MAKRMMTRESLRQPTDFDNMTLNQIMESLSDDELMTHIRRVTDKGNSDIPMHRTELWLLCNEIARRDAEDAARARNVALFLDSISD